MEIGGTTTQNGPKMDPWNHRNLTEPYNWNRRTLSITEFQALALTQPWDIIGGCMSLSTHFNNL